uniref:Ubiquitin-like domain-containing protein n=1 Tax=Romanomermis culicivorax TaxID=13658 RepID=A0A915IE02_ROMCU
MVGGCFQEKNLLEKYEPTPSTLGEHGARRASSSMLGELARSCARRCSPKHARVFEKKHCVNLHSKVHELKELLSRVFYVSVEDQKLLCDGRTMKDGEEIGVYTSNNIDQKLHLIINKSQEETDFRKMLYDYLRDRYNGLNENLIKKFVDSFSEKMTEIINTLSLDDLERFATLKLDVLQG